MSTLDTPRSPEPLEVPSTVNGMIEKYLAFQERGSPEDKKTRLENALQLPKVRKYAEALMELARVKGMQAVVSVAEEIRNATLEDMEILALPRNGFIRDRSWAMLDVGKKYYYSQHPGETTNDYAGNLADPTEDTHEAHEIRADISNTRLAWEARKAYGINVDGWRNKVVDKQNAYALARPLLRQPGDEGMVHSHQLADLGEILHTIAEQKHIESTVRERVKEEGETSEEEIRAEEEKSHDTEPPPNVINLAAYTSPAEPETAWRAATKTPFKIGKATLGLLGLGALFGIGFTVGESAKILKESATGMFGVLMKLIKSGGNFKELSKGVADGAAGGKKDTHGEKHDAKGGDHAKHDDHGHGDHGDHGSHDAGHAAAGHGAGGHGKAGGGHHGKGGGGHGGGHAKKPSRKGAKKAASGHGH